MNSPVMSEEQREAVGQWVRNAMDMMLLADVQLVLLPEPPEEDENGERSAAEVYLSEYRQAVLKVSAGSLLDGSKAIEHYLLHEITHMYHADLRPAVLEMIDDDVTAKRVGSVLTRYIEGMVDQISRVFQLYVPMAPVTDILNAKPVDNSQDL